MAKEEGAPTFRAPLTGHWWTRKILWGHLQGPVSNARPAALCTLLPPRGLSSLTSSPQFRECLKGSKFLVVYKKDVCFYHQCNKAAENSHHNQWMQPNRSVTVQGSTSPGTTIACWSLNPLGKPVHKREPSGQCCDPVSGAKTSSKARWRTLKSPGSTWLLGCSLIWKGSPSAPCLTPPWVLCTSSAGQTTPWCCLTWADMR